MAKIPEIKISDCIFGIFDDGGEGGILLNKEATEIMGPALLAAMNSDEQADSILTTLFSYVLTMRHPKQDLMEILNFCYDKKEKYEKMEQAKLKRIETPKRDIDEQPQNPHVIHVKPNKFKS